MFTTSNGLQFIDNSIEDEELYSVVPEGHDFPIFEVNKEDGAYWVFTWNGDLVATLDSFRDLRAFVASQVGPWVDGI